jgi:hypothetical protein
MKFHIDDDVLTIQMEGGEAFWAIKRKLVVPRSAIAQAVWQEDFMTHRARLGWRFGTLLPGHLFAGTFVGPDGRSFLYMRGAQGWFGDITARHVLRLELAGHPYRRVLVTVDDQEMAEQIVDWATRP